MSIDQSDSDHTLPLTPASSFGPLDTVAIDTAVPTGQLVVTSQVPTQATTYTSANATNPFTTIILVLTRMLVATPLAMSRCGFDWRVKLVAF